jgi:hypothetical protein
MSWENDIYIQNFGCKTSRTKTPWEIRAYTRRHIEIFLREGWVELAQDNPINTLLDIILNFRFHTRRGAV